jgi:hypothetical protein
MSFLGADTDELRGAADECLQGKEVTDQVIQYLQALIALLKAASFFSGGASAAYATYLETVVVPWLQKISMALELFAKVLGANAEAQDQASQGETVDAGSLPSYTSQVSGSSAVQPFNGSVLGSGSNAGAAFGAITGAAAADPSATPTSVTVTSPDGTVTTVGPGASSDTGGAAGATPVTTAPVTTTPISTTTTDGVISRDGGLTGLSSADLRNGDGSTWVPTNADSTGGGGGAGSGGGGSMAPTGSGGGTLGTGSVDGGAGVGTDAGSVSDSGSGPTAVHSSMGTGGGTPGADALTGADGFTGDSVGGSDSGNGTSYGAAAGIAGGAGALGLGGAALAARQGGTVTGGADPEIDRLAAANGRGSRGADVTNMQQRLTDAGYDTQGVDGKWGANTQAAYDQYRAANPLPMQTGTGYSAPSGFDYNQIRGVRNNPNVTPEFLRQVEGVAQRVGAKPEELMGVMSLETMGTFRPSVANPDTHATGLIQFMPRTAQGLGTSIGDLSRMTPSEQLPWVEKYLSQPAYRGRVGSLEGLYSAVLPGHIMGADEVMFRPGTAAYNANRWLDTDHQNGISVQEAVQQVRIRMGQGAR